jgi:hypothetical protein
MATASRSISRDEARGSALLWFGLLGAPLAWITQLVVDYSLEEWFACSPGGGEGEEILGMSVQTLAIGISVVLLAIAVAAGLVALRCFARLKDASEEATASRARWMAVAGIMNSVLYVMIILASFAPPLILESCRYSP